MVFILFKQLKQGSGTKKNVCWNYYWIKKCIKKKRQNEEFRAYVCRLFLNLAAILQLIKDIITYFSLYIFIITSVYNTVYGC